MSLLYKNASQQIMYTFTLKSWETLLFSLTLEQALNF